ncbi:MAG: ABC transporter substrate-binding protein [Thermoleophilia bacterium]|nr:ABC transporter substrate-binding protein [Thermoleophilia bacterium]
MPEKEKAGHLVDTETSCVRAVSRREFLKLAGAAGAVIAIGGGIGGLLAGCGDGTTTTTAAAGGSATTAAGGGGTVSTGATKPTKQLKVGTLVSLQLTNGIEMQKWMDIFAKTKNESGGWEIGGERYELVPITYDVGLSDATTTRAAVEKAVLQDGVKFIVGSFAEVSSVSVTITEPNKALWMGTDFTPATLDPNFKYVVRGQGLSFALGAAYNLQSKYVERGATRSVIVDPDNQQTKVGNQIWAASGRLAGLETLDPITYTTETTDFGPIATKVKSLNVDLVELAYAAGDQIVNIVRALKDVGYEGFIYPGNVDQTIVDNMAAQAGKEYIEGQLGMYYDPREMQTDPVMRTYIDRYLSEHGKFQMDGVFWVSPWFLFEDAVNTAQSVDVDAVTAALKSMDHGVRTLCGHTQLFARPDIGILDTVDSAPGHYLCEIKDGVMTPFGSVSVKDQYLVSIKALGLAEPFKQYWAEHGEPTFPDEESLFDFSML